MNELVKRVVDTAREKGIIPMISEIGNIPLPAIKNVELYTTYRCNLKCDHCITNSGPERQETLEPDDAYAVIEKITEFSFLNRLGDLFGHGEYRCEHSHDFKKLEKMEEPPERLNDELKQIYSDCLLGRDDKSRWYFNESSFIDLNFTRPVLRISGGEFFMWPYKVNGEIIPEEKRLCYQRDLLKEIRNKLPGYDVWILTNGSFADNKEYADNVIRKWAEFANSTDAPGKTRICISVDVFHSPPSKSTIEDMIKRIWSASRRYDLGAPFLYGIPNNRIGYLGRAFKRFKAGFIPIEKINNFSKSEFNPASNIYVDPVDLAGADGCKEVKGFYLSHGDMGLIINNIVISPSGRLVYCCACLGDYGDFINEPRQALRNVILDPITLMLKRTDTVIPLFNIAVDLDPTIKVFGAGEYPAVTASTCYQMMTGERR